MRARYAGGVDELAARRRELGGLDRARTRRAVRLVGRQPVHVQVVRLVLVRCVRAREYYSFIRFLTTSYHKRLPLTLPRKKKSTQTLQHQVQELVDWYESFV